jgi:NiFe hydrogenase small subunit HydA
VCAQVLEYPAIWVAGAACSGCSVSLLNTINPSIQNVLVDPVLPGKHVSLKFHAVVMAGQGEPVLKVTRETAKKRPGEYLLIVDGSIPTACDGLYCTLGEIDGVHVTMKDLTKELAKDALCVMAVGTCAAFGGIPKGAPNPTGAMSVSDFFTQEKIDKPLINRPTRIGWWERSHPSCSRGFRSPKNSMRKKDLSPSTERLYMTTVRGVGISMRAILHETLLSRDASMK